MSNYHAVTAAAASAKPKTKLLRQVVESRALKGASAEAARESQPLITALTKGNARSSGYNRSQNDWYQEPRRAIDALLDVEKFQQTIWDPACGGGNIPKACADKGYTILATDLVYRGYGLGDVDFLTCNDKFTGDAFSIITNPPFSLAAEFVIRAFDLGARRTAVLQRTTWLEGERRYQQLFRHNRLQKIWQFRSRISMPPGGKDVEAKNGSVAYAWFVFDQAQHGAPTFGWLP